MAPTLLDMDQIFGFRPHGCPVDAVGDYHRKKNQEKLAKPFIISPATINQNCSFSNYLRKFSAEKDKDQQYVLFLLYWLNSSSPTIQTSAHCHHGESPEPVCSNYSLANLAEGLLPRTEALHLEVCCSMAGGAQKDLSLLRSAQKDFVLSTLDPSLTKNIGGQSIQAGEVIDLELPSGDEEDETLAEQLPVQATLSGRRNKKKETAPIHENSVQLEVSLKVLLPLLLSQKGVERGLWWSMWPQKNLQQLPPTSGTDEELREAFEAMEQERELVGEEGPQEKTKKMKEEEIPAEVIAESIALAQKQQETPRAKLTSSELVLFEDAEEEHSTAVLAELLVAAPESEIEVATAVLGLVVEVPRTARVLVVMTSPFKPPIVAVKFEAMDLEPSWTGWRNSVPLLARPSQRQWMRQWRGQNMAPKPILEMSLGLARDVLNLHDQCREVQNMLGAGLSSKTKATFLVQSTVSASRPTLEIAEASIHQGVLLQKELSIKKASLQESLKKLGF
ncbi:unnamed protein product [Prunus armeniaca]